MSRNLLSSFSEYRDNGLLQPLAILHLPSCVGKLGMPISCLHPFSRVYHERSWAAQHSPSDCEMPALFNTEMKSKIKRAQRSVDYEPGIMSGLSRSPPLLSGVGEVREEHREVLRCYRRGIPVLGAGLTECRVSAYITSDVPGSLGGHDGNGIASQVVAFLLSFFHGLAIEALGKEGRHFQLENSHSQRNPHFWGRGVKRRQPLDVEPRSLNRNKTAKQKEFFQAIKLNGNFAFSKL